MSNQTVSSGVISSGLTISAGETLTVKKGGSANVITVSGGTEDLSGSATKTTAEQGGSLIVFDRGHASDTIVGQDGYLTISSGGVANVTTISQNGYQSVSSGGFANATTVEAGGFLTVYAGGIVTSTTVSSGGFLVVLPGANVIPVFNSGTTISTGTVVYQPDTGPGSSPSQSGLVLVSGGLELVLRRGQDTGGTIGGGATQQVFFGGAVTDDVVQAGGSQQISAGGIANLTTLNGGNQTVYGGGSVSSTVIDQGASQYVWSGGSAVDTMINSGNAFLLGTATGTTVEQNGSLTVSSGGVASNTTIEGGGFLAISSGGTVTNATVAGGGYLVILPGGSATSVSNSGLVISSGLAVIRAGSASVLTTTSGNVVASGGTELVLPGGHDLSGTVNGGAIQEIFSGGAVVSGTIQFGGTQQVSAGGTTTGTTLNGGVQNISVNGIASGTLIEQGASESVYPGGLAVDTSVSDGFLLVSVGGSAIRATVLSGGVESVTGSAADTLVELGGNLSVFAGGVASAATVEQGGSFTVLSGGQADGTTVETGGLLAVSSGASANATKVAQGGLLTVYTGGVVTNATVSSGGSLVELPGAIVGYIGGSGAVISSGIAIFESNTPIVVSSSVANRVLSGGMLEFVLPGGQDSSGTVGSGAIQQIFSGGRVTSGVVEAGGSQQIFAGGTVTGMTVNDAVQITNSGATAITTVLNQGAVEYVYSGGIASDSNVNGAFVLVNPGGSATGDIVSSGGYEVVAGVVNNTTLGAGGAEVVVNGGDADGTTVLAGAGAYITGSASNIDIASGGMGAVGTGGVTTSITIGSGGIEFISAGGIAIGTTIDNGGVELVFSGATDSGTTVESGGTYIALQGALGSSPISSSGATIVNSGVVVLSGTTVSVSADPVTGPLVGGTSDYVLLGGVENSVVVSNHAYDELDSGGTVYDTTIQGGGTLVVASGGLATDAVTLAQSGGTLVVAQGGTVSGVIFAGSGGTIVFNSVATSPLAAVISGFVSGDEIDFNSVPGGSPTITLLPDNVLVVSGGGITQEVTLAGDFSDATFSATPSEAGGVEVTVSQSASSETVSAISSNSVAPIDIPLYVLPFEGDGYKVGIEVSLDGGATYKMDEFDTGGTGFYAAYNPSWWSSYSLINPAPVTMSYASGNTYTAQLVATDVTLQTEQNGTVNGSINAPNAAIGLITSAVNPGKFTTQGWNSAVTSTPSTPPLEGDFYGDFGMGLGSGNGLASIIPQLSGGLSNGFIITIGAYPSSSGTLQVGLTQSAIDSFISNGMIITMQGRNTLDTYPSSGQPTYTEVLASGSLTLSNGGGNTYTTPSGFVFDTGAPTMEVHPGSILNGGSVTAALWNNSENVSIGTPPAAIGGDSWTLSFPTGANSGQNQVNISDADSIGDSAGYVNTGLIPFFDEQIMYDVADGIIGIMPIACFAAGTQIMTPCGNVEVSVLEIGDTVMTMAGEPAKIAWIGYRRVNCARHPSPHLVLPVLIRTGAFGPNLPQRDLLLSPDHALFFEGVLIPVKYLLNGETVVQVEQPTVTYYHIELARHDVILAEGLPTETYLDTDDRKAFANGGKVVQANPTFGLTGPDFYLYWEAWGYAPLVVAGPQLARAKLQLRRYAGRQNLVCRQPSDRAVEQQS